MKIRERIYEEIKNMSLDELSVLYEQIRLMAKIKQKPKEEEHPIHSIEKIQQMTLSSKSNWAETVISERKERL